MVSGLIETKRFILVEFNIEDAEAILRLNQDVEVLRFTGDEAFESLAAAEMFLKNYDHYRKYGYGRWAVRDKSSGEFIGWCGLKCHEAGYVDVGFRFFRCFWNKGYATEAAYGVLNYGFKVLHLKEIIGRVSSENKASICVLEKLGMVFWKHGVCEDFEGALFYKLSKTDFFNKIKEKRYAD